MFLVSVNMAVVDCSIHCDVVHCCVDQVAAVTCIMWTAVLTKCQQQLVKRPLRAHTLVWIECCADNERIVTCGNYWVYNYCISSVFVLS